VVRRAGGGAGWRLLFCAAAPDLAEDTAFGSPATQLVVAGVLAVTVVGTLLTWRSARGSTRTARSRRPRPSPARRTAGNATPAS
jgi:hypothetical protein